ncbi:SUF system NifU family Fe-S cluster assembly protein [Candidatus Pacearchaeota archaeon]|nr:SUF system NifU family Fe-S cluster assembly protein [Candidatus Pacearchaeota archaeon]
MNELNEIYTGMILELYRNPLHKGKLDDANAVFRDLNPVCGDEIEIGLKIKFGRVNEGKFDGRGCAISQAAASMLLKIIHGKEIEDILKIDIDNLLEEMNLQNLKNNPVRIKCAALPLKVLKIAVIKYLSDKDN